MSQVTSKELRVMILYKRHLDLLDNLRDTSTDIQGIMKEFVRIGEDPSELLATIRAEAELLIKFCDQKRCDKEKAKNKDIEP